MEIILTQDLPKVGYKGDLLKVRPGYARNFLIPNGLALIATESNRKIMAENQRQAAHKIEKIKADAQSLADKLNNLSLRMQVKTGTSNKIFGSVTTLQVVQALKDLGYEIDRRKITLREEIKALGNFQATVDLHRDVKATLNLEIIPEE